MLKQTETEEELQKFRKFVDFKKILNEENGTQCGKRISLISKKVWKYVKSRASSTETETVSEANQ